MKSIVVKVTRKSCQKYLILQYAKMIAFYLIMQNTSNIWGFAYFLSYILVKHHHKSLPKSSFEN